MRVPMMLTSLTLLALPLAAQSTAAPPTLLEQLRAAMEIPIRSAEIREAGVPDREVRSILDVFQRRRLPATDVMTILTAERDGAREHGPTDNFGAFVQARLDQGLRGRELAAAIRAEHARNGKGKVKARDAKDDDHDGREDDDDRGRRADSVRSDAPDRPAKPTPRGQGPGRRPN